MALPSFCWKGRIFEIVRKDFVYLSPATLEHTVHDDEKILVDHGIDMQARNKDQKLPKPVDSFEDCAFPAWLSVRLCRWTKPTPIQVAAWPAALSGSDILGIADTGSGKTLAYLLPMLVHVLHQPHLMPGDGPIGLVVVPTQELCSQIRDQVIYWSCEKGI